MTKQAIKPTSFVADLYEQAAWQDNRLVCGIDEAGRGCFAGPVVVAAAILKPGRTHRLLKDSKTLTQSQREEAFSWIEQNAWFSACLGTPEEIELYNILNTTKKKMLQAFINLISQHQEAAQALQTLLIDAVPLTLPSWLSLASLSIESFPFGESRSISIAAASIVAKVTRDRLMEKLDSTFPPYGFAQHKGYGTQAHQEALARVGKSIVHRPSFLKKLEPTSSTPHQQLLIG